MDLCKTTSKTLCEIEVIAPPHSGCQMSNANLLEPLERQPLLAALEKVQIKEVIAPYA